MKNEEQNTMNELSSLYLASDAVLTVTAEAIIEPDNPGIAYLLSRGISRAVIQKSRVRYDESYYNSTWKRAAPHIIIPSGNSEVIRCIHEDVPDEARYVNKKGMKTEMFQLENLNQSEPVIVVEGIVDAMSIETLGYPAIALNSANNWRHLFDAVLAMKSAPTLIISLDNDKTGNQKQMELVHHLYENKIGHYSANLYSSSKDANERMRIDHEGLAKAIGEAVQKAKNEQQQQSLEDEAQMAQQVKGYQDMYNVGSYMDRFLDEVREKAKTPPDPTGFEILDDALGGGLMPGLTSIGAISSLGKTTYALQIADYISASGRDVMVFSLEMSRFELVTKSLSRVSYLLDRTPARCLAKSALELMRGDKYPSYSKPETDLIADAILEYKKIGNHLFIVEGGKNTNINAITKHVEQFKKNFGRAPVVIIDYLQIIPADDPSLNDKRNIDLAVTELRQLARDFWTPVLVISAFNRENYSSTVSMKSFKESGRIEYSSDILLGMQLKGIGSDGFNEMEAKKRNPREIEVVLLKTRLAPPGETIGTHFYAKNNYFNEIPKLGDRKNEQNNHRRTARKSDGAGNA